MCTVLATSVVRPKRISYAERILLSTVGATDLSSEQKAELQKVMRWRTAPVRVVERCRIVLLAAERLEDKQITERLSATPRTASRWRSRFKGQGVWPKCRRIRGRPSITAEKVAHIVAKRTRTMLPNGR